MCQRSTFGCAATWRGNQATRRWINNGVGSDNSITSAFVRWSTTHVRPCFKPGPGTVGRRRSSHGKAQLAGQECERRAPRGGGSSSALRVYRKETSAVVVRWPQEPATCSFDLYTFTRRSWRLRRHHGRPRRPRSPGRLAAPVPNSVRPAAGQGRGPMLRLPPLRFALVRKRRRRATTNETDATSRGWHSQRRPSGAVKPLGALGGTGQRGQDAGRGRGTGGR